ncbi:MAG: SpoIIE family protein phosphatase [Rhodobacteraceae bacterium]|nr:SpoIIE family protein phosphatase [Alphaproteobacteria bacterium]NNK66303.1 SpoIIE family protein phosphatase [Paracoccaceae bacterium]
MRRVLIVDDSRAQLRILSAVLLRWGYEVFEATSGARALELLAREEVDLILSDWMMPEMSGLEFCRQFRASDNARYAYFILLTLRNAREDVATGLSAGADDFLSKPLDVNELRARIAAGERLIATQRELFEKNRLLGEALGELQLVYDNIARDLVEARNLQQSLVPDEHLRFDGADVSLLLRASGHVGGDLVGAFEVNDTRIGLYAIDVSGHGIASALLAARLAGHLTRANPDQNLALTHGPDGTFVMRPVAEICADLNRMIHDEMATELYCTLLIIDVDLATGHLKVAQAGHPAPLLQNSAGTVSFLGGGGHPIGLVAEAEYKAFDVRMSPGDRLLVYSDGITESTTPDGLELGQDGLELIVRRDAGLKGPGFLDALLWELNEFSGSAEPADDISAVFLEYHGRRSRDEGP